MVSSDLHSEYQRRYATEMRFFTGRPGVVRAACQLYGDRLPGAHVVDCGCGSGRSSFAFARLGATVEAFDFSAESVSVCEALAGLQAPLPLEFSVCDAACYEPRTAADLVFMLDIVEHVPDPGGLLAQARQWLAPGGRLVITAPGFLNLRGMAWLALQECFGLVMSPSDLRQILPRDVESWGAAAGFSSCAVAAGTCYGWGWAADAASDMQRRVALAVRDKRLSDPAWAAVTLHQGRWNAVLGRLAAECEPLMEQARGLGEPTRALEPSLREDVPCPYDPETVRRYLADDLNVWHDGTRIEDDFVVVTAEPWSRLGAITLYELTA